MNHLHLHSEYSLGDSIIKPKELIARLKEIGQTAVAITDHGNMYAGTHIYKLCKESGIKYIHGIEFYCCDDTSIKDKNNRYYHLIALCKNEQGRLNLNELVSLSNLPENFYFKPRIDFKMLEAHADGLIIGSACLAGELSRSLMQGNYDDAKERALRYKSVFGDDYYIEIQAHTDADQVKVNSELVKLADECGIGIIATCDAHYVWEQDKPYQNIYAFSSKSKEDGELYTDCFVQSEDEVRIRLASLPPEVIDRAIHNTDVIAEKCNVELPLSAPIMPKVDTPPQYENNLQWLQALCDEGFKTKLNFDRHTLEIVDKNRTFSVYDEEGEYVGEKLLDFTDDEKKVYIERYEYELDKLARMGFIDYILLVYSYANIGKRRGIGRGSGGGSIINYLTNITDIDPIEHRLLFERFIDVGSIEALEAGQITAKELKVPDIDLDFSGEDCTKVLMWLKQKYGEERVASIGKFGNNHTRGTIRDVGKAMGFDLTTVDMISKSFGETKIEHLDELIEAGEKLPESLEEAYQFTIKYPKLFEYVRKLSGLPKSFGRHACGKVISTAILDYYLPSSYDENGIRFLQGDMHDVEDVGLVKVDLLGLRTLDHEFDALEMAGEPLSYIDPKQNFNDKKVFSIFNTGDTTGIFQFSSSGMKNTLKKMKVASIDDLSIANALFRPGAMPYIDAFCNRRNGVDPTEYLHPDLEPILNNTYGIMVFQEQLIQIGRVAGLRNSDLLRKATSKKNVAFLEKAKPELHEKLLLRGWTEEQFAKLWESMVGFVGYSFNKSHSSAYAILAYMTAKLKTYHPAEFFAGLMNSYIGESSFVKDSSAEIFADIAKHNIQYIPLSFRNDHRKCSVVDGKIVYAIPLIRDLNTETAEILYKVKDYKGNTFWELIELMYKEGLRRASIDVLISLDFFSEFGFSTKLRKIVDAVELLDWGEKKSIKKNGKGLINNKVLYQCINNNSTDLTAKGVPGNTFKEIDIPSVLTEYENIVMKSDIPDVQMKVKIVNQKEYIGLAPFPTGRDEDRPILFVTDVKPLYNKTTGSQFGMSVFTSSLGSGKQSRFSVKGAQYRDWGDNPINPNDVIKCLSYDGVKWFNLKSWKQMY